MSDKIERIIDALRKKILESAIRGELAPQNPEDEPAAKLLERIAEERERLIKEKKIKKPKSTSRIFRRDGHFYESINDGKPNCIDDDIPFEIPDSWEWCRLEGFCLYGEAPSIKVNECTPETWVLDLEDIVAHAGRISKRITASERPSSSNKYSFDRGSVLYSKLRPYLNKVIVAEEPGCCTTEIIPIRLFAGVSPYYLQNLLMSPLFVEEINNEAYGVKMPRADTKLVKSFLIPVPPIQEQLRIVGFLEAQNEKLNTLQQSRKRYKRVLKETPTSLRQQLIQAAIQGLLVPQNPNDEPASKLLERIAQERTAKLGKKAAKSMSRIERRGSKTYEIFPDGKVKDISDEIPFEIPDSWEWCRLSYISNGLQYGTSQKSHSTGKYAVLRMGNIQNGEIDFSDLVYSNNDADFSKLELKNGDVLFNRTNSPEWVGKTAIFRNHKTPCIFAGYIIRINQSEHIVGGYLNYFLNSSCARKQGDEVVSLAVNQANISGAKLSDYFIPIPPLLEQHRIVGKLDALLKLV